MRIFFFSLQPFQIWPWTFIYLVGVKFILKFVEYTILISYLFYFGWNSWKLPWTPSLFNYSLILCSHWHKRVCVIKFLKFAMYILHFFGFHSIIIFKGFKLYIYTFCHLSLSTVISFNKNFPFVAEIVLLQIHNSLIAESLLRHTYFFMVCGLNLREFFFHGIGCS